MPTCGGERCCWCLVLFIASGSLRGGRNRSALGFLKRIYMAIKRMTMGLIVGNRGFFPDHLAKSGREEMLRALASAGMDVVALTPEQSKYGAVETREETKRCAELFKLNRDRIDGVVVTLPNFGEERAIADTLRLADLRVPVLIQATPDDPKKMTIAFRRDSFCGKMSACNNLRQYGIPYSITTLHTESPDSPEFATDLDWFGAVCRVVKGFRNLRVGAIGARPAAFNTVRYSEKILEANGVSIETLDLSEVLGRIERMKDNDDAPQAKLAAIQKYVDSANVPKPALLKMDFQEIIAGTVGKENTFGTCVGLIKPGPMSFARFSTNDTAGKMRGYVGEGRFTDDPLNTFGGAGVVEIPRMQKLLHFICENGFEHHVAANLSTVDSAVHEATTRYLGWEMYWHERPNGAC